jgi:Malectin domain
MHVTSSLVILVAAVLAVLTLHGLGLLTWGPRDRPRRRARTVWLIVVLLCSALVIAGADAAAATARASFRTAIARNLGAIDETVTGKTAVPGGAARYLKEPGTPFFPAYTADRLRTSLTGVAGVVGAIVQPAAFPDRGAHQGSRRTGSTRGELLGVPATYPTAFGPLTTVRGQTVTLGQLGANQVYINQTAARVLGVQAGEQLQLRLRRRPTVLYFAAGSTGRAPTNGQPTFAETLVLYNTTSFPATATLTYLIQDADPLVVTRVIPPHATLRESVNRDVGPNRSVAVVISSPARLTAQRLLRRLDAHGATIDVTSTPGISAPGTTLSFAADNTGRSDQVSVALANPGVVAARVSATVTSHAGSSTGTLVQSVTVPAQGRATLSLDHPAGSLRVTSDQPIVAERVRYACTCGAAGAPARRRTSSGPQGHMGASRGSASRLRSAPHVVEGVHTPTWTITPGVAVAGTPQATLYAPVVRAVLRNQNLAAGGLLSGGAQGDPVVLVPLQRLQQVIGQPGQITTVLVSNHAALRAAAGPAAGGGSSSAPRAQWGDALAGAPLTDQVTNAIQALLADTDTVTTIKRLLILPRGQDALQALQHAPYLAASTQAKLRGVQAELAVPGTSDRLKSLLNDPAVIAALRTITDPAVTDTLDPAFSRLSPYTVQPVKQDGLTQADRLGNAVAARYRDWAHLALAAGILLSVLLVTLLPTEGRLGGVEHRNRLSDFSRLLLSRSYVHDLSAILLGVALGTVAGLGIVPRVTAQVNAGVFATQFQNTAHSVGAGPGELVVAVPSHPIHTLAPISTPTSTSTPTDTPTSASTPLHTPTRTPTSKPAITTTPPSTPAITALSTGTPVTTTLSTSTPLTGALSTGTPFSSTLSTDTPVTTTPSTGTPVTTPPSTGTPIITAASTRRPDTTALSTSTPLTSVLSTGTPTITTTAPITPATTAFATSTPVTTALSTSTPAATPTSTSVPASTPGRPSTIAIDSGGGPVGSFVADMDVSGGKTSTKTHVVDTSGVTDPAPQAVYRTERYGNFTYTVRNLTPGISYTVRLHFAEVYWKAAGKRVFNVAINNTPVLRHFDIYAAAGGADRAVVKEFTTTPSSSGVISITYTSVVNNAQSSGIEIVPDHRGE